MKKHLIITRLFEFGGSNTHLKNLLNYLGEENVILILTSENEIDFLGKITSKNIQVIVKPELCKYAVLDRSNLLSISFLKQVFFLIKSLLILTFIIIKNGINDVTINSTDPEKYLYFFWIPLIDMNYFLHSEPQHMMSKFTSYTCNHRLSDRKKIITVSYANQLLLLEKWKIKRNASTFVKVIYNCTSDEASFDNRSWSAPDKQKNIVTMGHLTAYKNPMTWVQVAREITKNRVDVNFIWLGNGELFNSLTSENKDFKNLHFIGYVSNTNAYLNDAYLYYQPSLSETQGIGVIEAMSRKLPCIVSAVGGLPESIANSQNGFVVQPKNVEEHVFFINKLLDNPKLAQQYGENGYIRYKRDFTFNSFKENLDTIYKSSKNNN